MKRIIYIFISIASFVLLSACADDNYDEPNSGITGHFIDADTSEPVPLPVQGSNGVRIKMFEKARTLSTGADHSDAPISFYGQIDGAFKNTWMFSTDYLIAFEQTNFYPIDTIDVKLLGGKITEHNIRVTPYSRIKVISAVINQKLVDGTLTERNLNITYKISRSRADYKIESSFLAWHISPYVDKTTGNYSAINSIDRKDIADSNLLDIELTQTIDLLKDDNFNNISNLSIIKGNNNRIFGRIGVTTNGKVNYSEVISVAVPFVNGK